MHHADWAPAEEGELRSELVTALRDDTGAVLVAGFLGGSEHDGTFRVRHARDGSDGVELWIEAFLGGAVLQPGERRELHAVSLADGEGDPSPLLEAWAAELGRGGARPDDGAVPGGLVLLVPLLPRRHRGRPARRTWRARPTGPSTCSSSTTASRPPSATGSTTNDKFPSSLDALAAAIAAEGRTPGHLDRARSSPAPTPRSRRPTPTGSPTHLADGHGARRAW